jgi:hypothetical protein
MHCKGVYVGNRLVSAPQNQALTNIRKGASGASDENLMNSAMMFNSLIRDGTAIECTDDANEGFRKLY